MGRVQEMGRAEQSMRQDAAQRTQQQAPSAAGAEDVQEDTWEHETPQRQQQKGAAQDSQDVSEGKFTLTGGGDDQAALDQDAAAAYQRYNPQPGTHREGGRKGTNKGVSRAVPPLPTLEGLMPATAGGGRGAHKAGAKGTNAGGGVGKAKGTAGGGGMPALGDLGLPGHAKRTEGLVPSGRDGVPTIEDLRSFVQQTVARVSKHMDEGFKSQMTDVYSTEQQRLHRKAKEHYDQVATSLQNTQAAVKQAQEQHVRAKEAVRKARDEAAARAEDSRELQTMLQGVKNKAEGELSRLRKKHKLA